MKQFSSIAAAICFIILNSYSYGQTASANIDSMWVDFDVYQNTEKGIKIHTKFSVDGMLNKRGIIVAYFSYSDGTKLKNPNPNCIYQASDGQVSSAGENYTPSYENSIYEDFKIFMPYKELHLEDDSYSLKFFISVFDNNYKQIAQSKYYNFDYNAATTTNKNSTKFEGGIITSSNGKTCMSIPCAFCNSTGMKDDLCSGCWGAGRTLQMNYYTYQPYYIMCPYCGGSGRKLVTCTFCTGIGHQIICSNDQPIVPITPIEGGGYIPPNDNIGGGSNSGKSKSISVCSFCGGTGNAWAGDAPDYTGKAISTYCSICKKDRYPHYHRKCTSCNGTGFK